MRALFIALYAAAIVARADTYEGKPIGAIRFAPPDQPLERSYIDRLLPFKTGDTLRLNDLSAAIENLFETGRYDDILVDAKLVDGAVELEFRTAGAWFVGSVVVDGATDSPNTGQLVSAAKLDLGSTFNEEDMFLTVSSLGGVLRDNGFYKAKLSSSINRAAENQAVEVGLKVETGRRARIAEPTVKGSPLRPLDSLIRATRWKRWYGLFGYKEFTEQRIQTGLARLRDNYQKSDHLMATVLLDEVKYDEATNTARPALTIEAGPQVRIQASGAKLSRGRVKQLVPVFQERSVDRDLLNEGRRNIAEHFSAQGFFDAEVEFTVTDVSPAEQLIEYAIDRGDRYRLAYLEVTGNRYFDAKTVRERLNVTPATGLRYRRGRYSAEMLRKDLDSLTGLYRSNGFAAVAVTSTVENAYKDKALDVAIHIAIKEGPQWFVSGLDVEGVNLKDFENVNALLISGKGQPFSEINIAADRDTVLNYYFNRGFPDASFEFTAKHDEPNHRVDLRYTINEGRRNFVRRVVVTGIRKTNPSIVDSRISVKPGEALSQSEMIESQRRLYDLGIFARVNMAVQNPAGLERDKTVVYQVEEASRYSLNYGFGAEIARIGGSSTNFDSPAGAPGFSPRVSLGVSRNNFLGLGHTVGIRGKFSNIQRRALMTYLAPRFKGNEKLNLTFSALFDDSRDVRTFSARRWEGTAQLGQKLSRATTAQYRLTYRQVSVDQNSLKIDPALIPLLSQSVRLGIVSATLIHDRRDDPIDTHRGVYNTFDAGWASRGLGSQSEFTRLLGRNSTYHRIGRDLILARTLTAGVLTNIHANDSKVDIPLPERFFAGGANSHRAFSDNQAGPRDFQTGFPLGGKALLVHQTELRFPLIGDNIGGVLFHDAGNVYSSLNKVSFRAVQQGVQDFDYMVHTLGFGVRYRTPVGPVRFDLGYGPNSPRFVGFKGTREELLFGRGIRIEQQINHLQFHFSLGQTF